MSSVPSPSFPHSERSPPLVGTTSTKGRLPEESHGHLDAGQLGVEDLEIERGVGGGHALDVDASGRKSRGGLR